MASDYVGGGFGRQMSRGKSMAAPEKEKPMHPDGEKGMHGQSTHVTIHKHAPGHFSVEHEHGKSEHGSYHEAAREGGKAMGEDMPEEPEGNEDVPMENALGMVNNDKETM